MFEKKPKELLRTSRSHFEKMSMAALVLVRLLRPNNKELRRSEARCTRL